MMDNLRISLALEEIVKQLTELNSNVEKIIDEEGNISVRAKVWNA